MWRFSLVVSIFLLVAYTQKSVGPKFSTKNYKNVSLTPIAHYSKKSAQIFNALITGEKRHLPRKFKKKIKALNLVHLFTPSGLHFSSFLLLLLPLSLISKKYFKWASFIICLIPFGVTGLYSMKRIALLRLFFIGKSKIKYIKNLEAFTIFAIAFTSDFIFGTYSHSPISFALSFLFIGAIFSSDRYSSFEVISRFIFAQILICILFNTFWNPIGSILGLVISSLFTFIFPFFLIDFLINKIFQFTFFSTLMDSFVYIIELVYEFSTNFDVIWPDIIFALAIYLSLFKSKVRYLSLPLLLIFSNPIENLPSSGLKGFQPRASHFPRLENQLSKVSILRRGYKTQLNSGFYCYHHLKRWGYTTKCQRKKLPKSYWTDNFLEAPL